MDTKVRKYLIELASKGKTISYQELSDACNLKLDMSASQFERAEIGRILGEISVYEHNNSRPLLSAIVVSKSTGSEGMGFFKLAQGLGLGPWKFLRESAFDAMQIKECFEFWSNKENYNNYINI